MSAKRKPTKDQVTPPVEGQQDQATQESTEMQSPSQEETTPAIIEETEEQSLVQEEEVTPAIIEETPMDAPDPGSFLQFYVNERGETVTRSIAAPIADMPTANKPVEEVSMPAAREPQPSEEVRVFAQTIRAYRESRDVRLDVAPGVICMFGYGGLMVVRANNDHRHIATVEELEQMSDQQLYDAVMEAGKKR